MENTLEHKILKYLSKNDNGKYVDISDLSTDKTLLKSKLIELRSLKYIQTNFGQYSVNGIRSDINFLAKITSPGIIFLNDLDNKKSIGNDFSNATIGTYIQDSRLEKSPITNNVKAKPKSKPEQKSFVKKLFSNWWFRTLLVVFIEEITFGKIWKFICSYIKNVCQHEL